MIEDKGIMKYESTLPADFDGTFWFTNDSDEEFIGIWGGEAYKFPPRKTSKMIMPKFSPLEVQHIRKKFAKDWAEKEFFRSSEYGVLARQEGTPGNRIMNSFQHAAAFTITELTPFIQRCLLPLPTDKITIEVAPKRKLEDELTRNDEGEINTEAIDRKVSLRKKALEA